MNKIVWLASYPKSGNTWVRIFLNNYVADGDAPVDINELDESTHAATRSLFDHLTGVESSDLSPQEIMRYRPGMYRQWSLEATDYLFVKVHDCWQLTDQGEPLFPAAATKTAVYIIRNPLDIVSSLANHYDLTCAQAIAGMADERYGLATTQQRLQRQLPQWIGSWRAHALSWSEQQHLPLLLLRYEDMVDDPAAQFSRLIAAIGLPLEQRRLEKAIAFSSFDQLQAQEAATGFQERMIHTPRFFRRGRSGGWREELTKAQVEQVIAVHGDMMRKFDYVGLPEHS